MASDGVDTRVVRKYVGIVVRERHRVPGGRLHAWTGERTLCDLMPFEVTVWPEDVRWNRGNYYTCRICLDRAEPPDA